MTPIVAIVLTRLLYYVNKLYPRRKKILLIGAIGLCRKMMKGPLVLIWCLAIMGKPHTLRHFHIRKDRLER